MPTILVRCCVSGGSSPSDTCQGYTNGDSMSMATARQDSPVNSAASLTPRFIRLRDAPLYLGMDKNRFNREVRPHVPVIRIGSQGIAFDRIDLDAWADEHKSRNGCPAAQTERSKPWETTDRQVLPNVEGSGISTKCLEEREFAAALEQAISPKLKSS